MPQASVLITEKCIAAAHRSLTSARDMASTWSDLGMHDDLQLLLAELERLQVDLLKGQRSRTPGRRSRYVSQY